MKRFICMALTLLTAFADADNNIDFMSFKAENDSFFEEDGLYSNGLLLSWGYDDVAALDKQSLPGWLAYLAQKSYLSSAQYQGYAITYSFAHLLQTAIDIKLAELVREDAPYVGMLAWRGQLSAYDAFTLDRASLTLGVVGPVAAAEPLQKLAHYVISANHPQGWNNQIGNEAVLQLQAERSWRVYKKKFKHTEMDLLTAANAGIGNLRSDMGVAVGLRWGMDLQSSFSSASAFPMQKLNYAHHSSDGWYLFTNMSAFYVLNDIFIDGNSFQESHSVDLIHQQYGASIGAMANIAQWNIVYTLLQFSDQYHGQNQRSRFGSLTFTYHF